MIYSYIRTSVWKKNKVTMEMQKNAIQRKLEELELPELPPENIYEDRGISGATLEGRMGLQLLLQRLSEASAKQSTLIVYRFNRLSRDSRVMISILERLEENDIKLISVMEPLPTENSISFQKMLINVYGTIAQFERDMTIENVKSGLEHKRRNNKPLSSNVPFGYSYTNEKLEPIKSELKIVRLVFDLYLTKRFGYKKICKTLNQMGHRFKGRKFLETDIYRILSNKTYYGILKGGTIGGEYRGTHQTVLSEEEFNTVQKIRSTRHTKKNYKRIYWLRSKVSCPVCEQNLTPKKVRNNKKVYHYYYCARPSCNQKGINATKLEHWVIKSIIQFITKNALLELMLNELTMLQNKASKKEKLNQRQRNYRKKKLFNQFEKNELTNEEFSKAILDLTSSETQPDKKQQLMITKQTLEKLLVYQPKIQQGSVPEEFYFNLVERVTLDSDFKIKGIYLKTLGINILEPKEIEL